MPFGFLKRSKEPAPPADAAAAEPVPDGIPFDGITEEWRIAGRMLTEGRMSDVLNRREPIPIGDVRWAPADGSEPMTPAPGLKSIDPYDLVLVFSGPGIGCPRCPKPSGRHTASTRSPTTLDSRCRRTASWGASPSTQEPSPPGCSTARPRCSSRWSRRT